MWEAWLRSPAPSSFTIHEAAAEKAEKDGVRVAKTTVQQLDSGAALTPAAGLVQRSTSSCPQTLPRQFIVQRPPSASCN